MKGFAVKELFKDLDQGEISFLNKALKMHCGHYGAPIGKRVLTGEKFPSNVWPDETKLLACALLTCRRIGMDPEIILHEQILNPAQKCWGLGVPNYNGNWEPHAKKALGFALPIEDSTPSTPSSDDDEFYPPLGSAEMKKRGDFLDLLDEIK